MPSFDIVNELDMQEVDNAVNNTLKTIQTRYDFKDSKTELSLNKKDKKIHIVTGDEMKMRAVEEMLNANMVKRGISAKALEYKDVESTSHGAVKRDVHLVDGIEKEAAKKIVKIIKDAKLKVQPQIMDETIRVTSKQIDDLQAVIALLKESALDVPLQYVNMKR